MVLFQCASSVPELSAVQDAEFASARNSLNDSMYPTGPIPIARSTLTGICSFLSVFKNFLVSPAEPFPSRGPLYLHHYLLLDHNQAWLTRQPVSVRS
jgi:hypothetical protein